MVIRALLLPGRASPDLCRLVQAVRWPRIARVHQDESTGSPTPVDPQGVKSLRAQAEERPAWLETLDHDVFTGP